MEKLHLFDFTKKSYLNIKVPEVEETPMYPLISMQNHRFTHTAYCATPSRPTDGDDDTANISKPPDISLRRRQRLCFVYFKDGCSITYIF